MDPANYAASGGITGAIITSIYIAYKCCYRKKFHSKCCGAEMDLKNDGPPSPEENTKVSFENVRPTPRPSPALKASESKEPDLPPLQV